MVALLLLPFECLVNVNVLWLFLRARWVGLQCVIVVFPDHNHLLFARSAFMEDINIVKPVLSGHTKIDKTDLYDKWLL